MLPDQSLASNEILTLKHVSGHQPVASIECRRDNCKESIKLSGSGLIAVQHEVSFEQLVDYVEGRLPAAEAGQISAHLQGGCTHCAEDVAWLRRTLQLMASDELVAAPPTLVKRVQRSYRQPQRRAFPSLAGLWAWLRNANWLPSRAQLRYAGAIAMATVVILAGAWWGWGNTTVAQAATLAEVDGPLEVRLPGSDEWQLATQGMTLTAGSALRSGEGASAVLLYADGSRTYLTEDAQLEILSLSGRRNRQSTAVRLNLQAGSTQHKLMRSHSSVQVEAGGAVAEGRKGDYEVRVQGAEVEVHAEHGNVSLHLNGTTTNLARGARGWVKGGHLQIATPGRGQPTDRGEGDGNGVDRAHQQKVTPPADTSQPHPEKGKADGQDGPSATRESGPKATPEGKPDKKPKPPAGPARKHQGARGGRL